MSENLRSMILGPFALYVIVLVAFLLTLGRRMQKPGPALFGGFTSLYLMLIACQCVHFLEEMLTGFHRRFPAFLGLVPWSMEFFVTLNISFIALGIIAAAGILKQVRAAYFMVWFFALAGIVNIIAHPLLALAVGGYFPGLFTAPVVGLAALALGSRLWALTE